MEFLIDVDMAGRFVWRAIDDRGEELVRSAPLESHQACVQAILVFKVEAATARTFDLTEGARSPAGAAPAAPRRRLNLSGRPRLRLVGGSRGRRSAA